MANQIRLENPLSIPVAIISFLTNIIKRFDYVTLCILMLLDILFSVPEGIFSFLTIITGGTAGLVTPAVWGALDIGLIALSFYLVLLLEGVIYKKGIKSLPLAIFAGLMMAVPFPLLTIVVLAYKFGSDLIEPLISPVPLMIRDEGTFFGKTIPKLLTGFLGVVLALFVIGGFLIFNQVSVSTPAGAAIIGGYGNVSFTPLESVILISFVLIGISFIVSKRRSFR